MSRGKPAGIRRKQAKEEAWIMDKLRFSKLPEHGETAECRLIESVHLQDAMEEWIRSEGLPNFANDVDEKILSAFKAAARTFDCNFFDRCKKAIEWMQKDRPLADPLAVKILEVLFVLMRKKRSDYPITSTHLVKELSRRYPLKQDYDDKHVRDVVKELGLGIFPLRVGNLRRDHLDSVRRISQAKVKGRAGGTKT